MDNDTPRYSTKTAKKYLELVDNKAIHKYYERPNLLSLISADLSNLSVLDAGCGSGWYTGELLRRGAKVTAIDNCQDMVNHTRAKFRADADIKQVDLAKPLTMFSAKQFDVIVAPLVIHYIQDWYTLFAELSRILKPGGRIYFSTHQPQSEFYMFGLENYYTKQIMEDTWQDIGKVTWYHHTLEELFNSMISAGLTIEKILEPMPKPEMKALDPDMYEKIITHPWFLFVAACRSFDIGGE